MGRKKCCNADPVQTTLASPASLSFFCSVETLASISWSANKSRLLIQKPPPSLFVRQGASFISPKYAIAITGHRPVSPVTKRPRQAPQQKSTSSPYRMRRSGSQTRTSRAHIGSSQVPKDINHRVRPSPHLLISPIRINHYVNRVQVPRIQPMPLQNLPSERSLQRRKSKDPSRIASQNKLY